LLQRGTKVTESQIELLILAGLLERQADLLVTRIPMLDRDETARLRALSSRAAGKVAEAIKIVTEVLEEKSGSAPAHEILGAALASQGDLDQGLAELRRAVELEPKRSSAMTKIGDILLARGQVEEAREQFLAAVKITPDDRLAHQRLGLLYDREGQRDLAIAHLERGIIGTPPGYIGVMTDLGRLYNISGKPEKTVALLQPVLTSEAQDASAWMVLGTAYFSLHQYSQALESFRSAERLSPGLAPARKRAADTLVALERLPDAIREYRSLLKVSGVDAAELYDSLGTAYQLNNEFPLAEKTFLELVKKHPGNPAAYLRLGMFYGYVKQYDRALEQFDGLLARFPLGNKAPDALLKAGMCHERLGGIPRAKQYFERLVREFPRSEASRRVPREENQ